MVLLFKIRMNKSSKSRIPIPVTKKKSSNLCNDENLQAKSHLLKRQTSVSTHHSIQNKTEKKTFLLSGKSSNFKDKDAKSTEFKNKASLNSKNDNVPENKVKSNDQNKLITYKTTMKPNVVCKRITKTSNPRIDVNNKTLSSFETKIKSNSDKSSVEGKKENFLSPSTCNFEPEACTPKEHRIKSRQGEYVEFEANEIYRKMILGNRGLSPSMCRLIPNLRLSTLQSERPSLYQKIQISDDPFKEALRALENLSINRVKKENKLPQSPYRNRDSIYTPCGDPNKEYLKRLEEFKQKQLQKTAPRSTKKVTFNLNIQECTPKSTCDIQHNPLKNSMNRLMQIKEKSEENTPNSPQCETKDEIKLSDSASNHEQISIEYKLNSEIKGDHKENETNVNYINIIPTVCAETAKDSDPKLDSNWKSVTSITPDKLLHQSSCWNSSPYFICDNKKNSHNIYTNIQEANNMQLPEQKYVAKICTPKPISFSQKSKMNQNYSPEFLVGGKSTLMFDSAPICTPLVLKGQARNIIFSPEADEGPIPLKLDFAEEEKYSPKRETCKNHTLAAFDNIVTIQKKLDYLADKECYQSLLNENYPVICGRYLTNPVATILSEGDEMHFIPVKL